VSALGTGDVLGSFLLLGAAFCILGASLTVCYAIWMRGWEGWESWNARTGLNEEEALAEKLKRFRDR
jgi:hypothetical protein